MSRLFLKAVFVEYVPVLLARRTVFFLFLSALLPVYKTGTGIFDVVQCFIFAVRLIDWYLQCQGVFLMFPECVLMVISKLHHLLN